VRDEAGFSVFGFEKKKRPTGVGVRQPGVVLTGYLRPCLPVAGSFCAVEGAAGLPAAAEEGEAAANDVDSQDDEALAAASPLHAADN